MITSVLFLFRFRDMGVHRLRNYIGKDWFLEIALQQEPSALAKRIAEVLDRPVGEEKGNATANDRSSEGLRRCSL